MWMNAIACNDFKICKYEWMYAMFAIDNINNNIGISYLNYKNQNFLHKKRNGRRKRKKK